MPMSSMNSLQQRPPVSHNYNIALQAAEDLVDSVRRARTSSPAPSPSPRDRNAWTRHIDTDQIRMYIDSQIVSMRAQVKQELKAEIIGELQTQTLMEVKISEIMNTARDTSEVKAQECNNLPTGPVREASAPESRLSMNIDEEATFELRYHFSGSVWNLAWFVGFDEIGTFGSVMAFGLYLMNLVMQISFCIICHRNFRDNAFSDKAIDGLNDFRLANAHDYRFYDKMFGKSLVEHICSQDPVYARNQMVYGARQLDVLNTVKEFLDSDTGGMLSIFAGKYMCMLALACWTLCVLGTLTNVCICLSALFSIPRGPQTVITSGAIEGLSRVRFFYILVIGSQELVICIFLHIYGCIWLSQTSDIQELLLNAAALEFVLTLDEMIFDALAPRPSRAFLENMTPLSLVGWPLYKGVDPFSIGNALFLPCVILFYYFSYVGPLVSQMRAAESALCAYDRNFLYGIDERSFVWIERLNATATSERLHAEARQSVKDIIRSTSHQNAMAGQLPYAVDVSIRHLDSIADVSAAGWVDLLNPFCADLVMANPGWLGDPELKAQSLAFLQYVRVYTNNFSISNCEDVLKMGLCGTVHHPAIVLCSRTCGCATPSSVVFSHKSSFGCPAACLQTTAYKTALASLRPNCTDFDRVYLQNSMIWQGWTHQMVASYDTSATRTIALAMSHWGCDFLRDPSIQVFARDFCEGMTLYDLRALGPMCPQACNCSLANVASCSQRCSFPY